LHAGGRLLFRIEMRAIPASPSRCPHDRASRVEGQLRARLAELQRDVAWGTELVAAEDRETGIKVTLRNKAGEYVVGADWLVGCDGAHSKTRSLRHRLRWHGLCGEIPAR